MSESEATVARPSARPVQVTLQALGNVLLGIAVGVAGYYLVTNLVTRYEQSNLRSAVPPQMYETRVTAGPQMDFEGWAQEDRAYWKRLPEGGIFGRLVCTRMGLDSVVVKGVSRADLRKGPGWITYTDLPGPTGNCGISGHRTTYLAPFRALDKVRPGDTIVFYSPYRRYTYKALRIFAVAPNRVDVVATTKEPQLTLTACHPPYSARQRLIVQSRLVEVRKLKR